MKLGEIFTGSRRRISRSEYWTGFALVVLIFGFGRYLLKYQISIVPEDWVSLVVLLWSVLGVVPLTIITVKRLNDRNRPAWLGFVVGANIALFSVAPEFGYLGDITKLSWPEHIVYWGLLAVSLFAFVETGFLRGTPGPNRYGDDPIVA